MGLKVDLIDNRSHQEVDAEEVLKTNIKEEAKAMPTVEVPTDSKIDVTQDADADEFQVLDNTPPVAEIVQEDEAKDDSDEGKEVDNA